MRSLRMALIVLILALGGTLCLSVTDGIAVAKSQPTPVASPAYPVRGVPFTVSGRLSTHVARPVQLQLLVGKKWTRVVSGTTLASGRYTLKTSSISSSSSWRVIAVKTKIGKKSYPQLGSRTRAIRTLSVTPSAPMLEEAYQVSDKLSKAVRRPVVLQRKSGKSWLTVTSGKTSSAGVFTLSVPHAASSVELRVIAKKIKIKKKTYSQVITKVSKIVAVGQSTAIAAPNSVDPNSNLTVTSSITPARAGRAVELQAYVAGHWIFKGRGTTDAAGNARINSIPTVPGVYLYRGVAAGWNGASSVTTQSFAVTVIAPVSVATAGLSAGIVGEAYNLRLTGSAGTVPYTWTATGLPGGLSLNASTGAISGTPTAAGTSSLHITIKDAHAKTSTKAIALTVDPAVSITTTSLGVAVVGEDYVAALAGGDGTAPYTWEASNLPNGLSIDTATGVISGKPVIDGLSMVSITITDAHARTNTAVFSLTVKPVVSIASASLADAISGDAYTQGLDGAGGTLPYAWTATDLPDGLSLDVVTGVISGTPTAVGASNVTITITDAHGSTASSPLTLAVLPAVSVGTISVAEAIVGELYTTTLTGEGGTAPYTWAAIDLPDGLSLNATTGEISGTPTTAGAPSVSITVTDAHAKTSTAALTLTVRPAVSVATDTLAGGVVGEAYTDTLAGAGGTAPYTWAADVLPDGLTIDPISGVISGTPTADGSTLVTVTVRDDHNRTNTRSLELLVGPVIGVATDSMAEGVVDGLYSSTLTARGGTAPYTWSATGLPEGLNLDSSSGVISGTPTAFGHSELAITITDANLRTSGAALTLTVNPPLWVTIGEQTGSLEPGAAPVSVAFSVENRGNSPLNLEDAVEVRFESAEGVAWAPPVGCDPSAYHAEASLTDGSGPIGASGTVQGVVKLWMDNLPTDQDACKGAQVPLHVRVPVTP